MVPVLRRLAKNPLQEIKECIEALYLDTQPNYFIENVPENWRCAHLEALLNPEGGLAQFSHYHEFKAHTEAWTMNSENRAAIAALDSSLMKLRERLLKPNSSSTGGLFPLEKLGRFLASPAAVRHCRSGGARTAQRLCQVSKTHDRPRVCCPLATADPNIGNSMDTTNQTNPRR